MARKSAAATAQRPKRPLSPAQYKRLLRALQDLFAFTTGRDLNQERVDAGRARVR